MLDRSRWLDGWVDGDGRRPSFGEVPLLLEELLPENALDDAEPDDRWLHEATGNANMTIEQVYRRAAFVIWPRSKALDIVRSGGIEPAVSWVSEQFDGADQIAREQIGDLVDRLIEIWPVEPYVSDKKARARMLRLLAAVADEVRTIHFLRQVVLHRYDGGDNEELLAALVGIRPDAGGRFLVGFVNAHLAYCPVDTLALLRRLGETAGSTWDGALREGVRQALKEWPAVMKPPKESDRTLWQKEERQRKPINHRAIHDLFALALSCGLADEAKAAAAAVNECPKVVRPDRIIPAALDRLRRKVGLTGSAAYVLLWRHAVASLLARSATVRRRRRGIGRFRGPKSGAIASTAPGSGPSVKIPLPGRSGSRCERICASTCIGSLTHTDSTCPT